MSSPDSEALSKSSELSQWIEPCSIAILFRVLVDEHCNGIAGPVGRKRKLQEHEWVARGALHAFHVVFPPPDVLQHKGGRDSVSI
jgi:hypothetical protein